MRGKYPDLLSLEPIFKRNRPLQVKLPMTPVLVKSLKLRLDCSQR